MESCPENTYVMCGIPGTPASEVVARTATHLAESGQDSWPVLIGLAVILIACGAYVYEWSKN